MKDKDDSALSRAQKVVSMYMQSTGSKACIHDVNYQIVPENGFGIEQNICKCCKGCEAAGTNGASSCREMHVNAIREASRQGGSHIYQCCLGLMFWTSPIYSEGHFAGALRGSGYLHNDASTALFSEKSNGAIPVEEFVRRVSTFPRGDSIKIKSLAEMLLFCAESLSSGSEDYHEILRRRSAQQQAIAVLIEKLKADHPEGSALPGYPLDKERLLIGALRRGDKAEAEHILDELLAALIFSNAKHFKYIQLRVLELVVLLSRAGLNPCNGGSAAMELSSRFHRKVQEAKSIEELIDILHHIVEDIAEHITSFRDIPHGMALRKAECFIRENFTRKISLREIAAVSGLSPPYFSTIFKEEMGENLSKYLNRLRVEKAGKLLLETNLSLSEIAGACCFEDQSWFSKIFKNYTGLSPGKYRSQGGGMVHEISEHNLSEDYLKSIS
jgi:AraC-like DNA-binding protein/ligand-binding sensor protein